jgi:hypothetical protein
MISAESADPKWCLLGQFLYNIYQFVGCTGGMFPMPRISSWHTPGRPKTWINVMLQEAKIREKLGLNI